MSVYKYFLTVVLVKILIEGTAVNGAINMPCPMVCPAAVVQYTCNITGDNVAAWIVRDSSGSQLGAPQSLVGGLDVGDQQQVGTSPFSATIDSYDNIGVVLVTTISYSGTVDVTGYQVQCRDSSSNSAICTVEEQEIPSAPTNLVLSSFAAGSISLTFDPPDNDDCVVNYTISLNGNTLTPTTDTSVIITKPDGDPPYTTYAVSVVAVDTGGRTGSSASIDCFLFSAPEAIVISTDVKLCTSTISSLMTIDIQVEWMQVESCLPEITSYSITHNISGVWSTEIVTGKDNTFTLTDVTSGEIYSLEIVPSNVIGPGQPTTTIISISSYHYSLSSSISKMTMPSSVSSPTVCTSGVGFSSTTLGTSIVVAIIFSAVASSIVTFLTTYFLFVKRNHCKSLKEGNGYTEKKLSQQAAVYEEVGVTGHSHRIATDSMNITANAAYGQI